MKNYISIIAAIITLVVITSCTDEGVDFDTNGGKGLAFTHFSVGELIIKANEAAPTAIISVSSTVKADAARSYTLIVDPESDAKEGTHFTLSSKTITIPAGEHHGKITLTANLGNISKDPINVQFLLADHADIIDWGKTLKTSIQIFCELDESTLVGEFNWINEGWEHSGKLSLEADPDDPYKIYLVGVPFELVGEDEDPDFEWNGNKITLNVNKTTHVITGPKVTVAPTLWGYGKPSFEVMGDSEFDTCSGEYIVYFRITVDEGSFGTLPFKFNK